MEKLRRRPSPLDLPARIRFSSEPDGTMTTYMATVLELTERGAMIQVDLPCGVRLQLFERVRYCILELLNVSSVPRHIRSRAVWLQPQTSAGDFMTFRIGLSFDQLTPDATRQIADFAASAQARNMVSVPPGMASRMEVPRRS